MQFINKCHLIRKAADIHLTDIRKDLLKDTIKLHLKVILALHKATHYHHKVIIKALPSKILLLIGRILNLPRPLINKK